MGERCGSGMARSRRIRISENDKKEYARLVRNTKAKIKRTFKNYGIDLSEEVEIIPLESFETRSDFNAFKDQLSSFTNRNNTKYQFVRNEYGTVFSKREINEMQTLTRRNQQRARQEAKRIENLPFYQDGQDTGMTVGERQAMLAQPLTGVSIPPDFDYKEIKSRNTFEVMQRHARKRSDPTYYDERLDRMKDNFITMIERAFNSDGDVLVNRLKDVSSHDFYAMYQLFESFDFNEYYIGEGIDKDDEDSEINRMLSDIEIYYRDNLSRDLRDF